VTLYDMSTGMLKEARGNLAGKWLAFRYLVVDAPAIPLGDSTLDAVIENHMLYHVLDRTMELSEIHRVLRPGGRLFVTTMGRGNLRELKDIAERIVPGAYSHGTSVEECGLENGTEQLTECFPEIALRRR